MVRSPDRDTNFFGFVAGVFLGDTLESDKFIIDLGYVLWTSIDLLKENIFTLKKRQETDDILQTQTT